jgi:hypothetical protein
LRSPYLKFKIQKYRIRSNVEKAHTFAEHLPEVFQLHPSEKALIKLLETPYQLKPSINLSKELKFKKSSAA